MQPHGTFPPSTEILLTSLAKTFLWYARVDEQDAIEGQVREALGLLGDPAFDMEAWARERLRGRAAQEAGAFSAEDGPFVVRAGPHVGIGMGQEWNERGELITAVQLHPGERAVLVEAGVEPLERDDILAAMRDEILAALTRACFLGLDPLAVSSLCQEALTVTGNLDMERLWAEAAAAPTLGDGEGVNQLVRIVGVQLHERFRVTLTFDDGVSRTLDLAPFLQGPAFTAVRRLPFFVQLRLRDGTLRWPNEASLDPVQLRYALP